MSKDTSADQNVARIKKEYLDYGKEVTRLRKPYVDAVKKEALKPLGPASLALLERINKESEVVDTLAVIAWAKHKTGIKQNEYWWFRRIVALAAEERIKFGVERTLDITYVYFQRKEGSQ